MQIKTINLPLSKEDALSLNAGDMVSLSGLVVTGRDKVHKFLYNERPSKEQIPFNLEGSALYHCGPILKRDGDGYVIVSGGPTTSMRVEMYEAFVIEHYGLSCIIGKGGMGQKTKEALKMCSCVYMNAISGAGAFLADRIKQVKGGWLVEEFGAPEAMWLLEVEDFPALVTMDAHGRSLHEEIEERSKAEFKRLLS